MLPCRSTWNDTQHWLENQPAFDAMKNLRVSPIPVKDKVFHSKLPFQSTRGGDAPEGGAEFKSAPPGLSSFIARSINSLSSLTALLTTKSHVSASSGISALSASARPRCISL